MTDFAKSLSRIPASAAPLRARSLLTRHLSAKIYYYPIRVFKKEHEKKKEIKKKEKRNISYSCKNTYIYIYIYYTLI